MESEPLKWISLFALAIYTWFCCCSACIQLKILHPKLECKSSAYKCLDNQKNTHVDAAGGNNWIGKPTQQSRCSFGLSDFWRIPRST